MMTQEDMTNITKVVDLSLYLDESTKENCKKVMFYAETLDPSLVA